MYNKEEILNVEGVSFQYEKQPVLQDICFSLRAGDFLGIHGENGTGKTTLMKIILGLLPYETGKITLFGTDRKIFREPEKLGYVSQKANSFNSSFPATVEEVVAANLYTIGKGKTRAQKRDMVEEVLEEVGLADVKKRLIGQLSGGQQQRVFIARTLVSRPKLMLLDEPTVGVDAKSVDTITELLQRLNQKGVTIMMTNHDTHALESVANRMLVLAADGSAVVEEVE